jgi:hypothetical protein
MLKGCIDELEEEITGFESSFPEYPIQRQVRNAHAEVR